MSQRGLDRGLFWRRAVKMLSPPGDFNGLNFIIAHLVLETVMVHLSSFQSAGVPLAEG